MFLIFFFSKSDEVPSPEFPLVKGEGANLQGKQNTTSLCTCSSICSTTEDEQPFEREVQRENVIPPLPRSRSSLLTRKDRNEKRKSDQSQQTNQGCTVESTALVQKGQNEDTGDEARKTTKKVKQNEKLKSKAPNNGGIASHIVMPCVLTSLQKSAVAVNVASASNLVTTELSNASGDVGKLETINTTRCDSDPFEFVDDAALGGPLCIKFKRHDASNVTPSSNTAQGI